MQRGYGICHARWAFERWLLSDWELENILTLLLLAFLQQVSRDALMQSCFNFRSV